MIPKIGNFVQILKSGEHQKKIVKLQTINKKKLRGNVVLSSTETKEFKLKYLIKIFNKN